MNTRQDVPRNGPARALWEADEDTPVGEIGSLLDVVERWECSTCGEQKFTRPERCSRCGEAEYQKTVPKEESIGLGDANDNDADPAEIWAAIQRTPEETK